MLTLGRLFDRLLQELVVLSSYRGAATNQICYPWKIDLRIKRMPMTISPAPPAHSQLIKRLKSFSWRLTALVLWVSIASFLFGLYPALSRESNVLWTSAYRTLQTLDLAPTSLTLFRSVLLVGWLLLITGFRVSEIFGFFLYWLISPITVLFWLLFRDAFRHIRTSASSSPPSTSQKKAVPWRKILAVIFLLWFVLYSDAPSRAPILLGAALSLSLFAAFLLRALLEARPPSSDEVGRLPRIVCLFSSITKVFAETKMPTSRAEALVLNSIYERTGKLCRRLTVLIRGPRGRARIAAYGFTEYLFSVVWLALLAICFWTFFIRAALLPVQVDYTLLLSFVLSHFLPGIPAPVLPVSVSQWTHIGPASTFWLLLVLYIGAASSLLPERQKAYVARVSPSYKLLRTCTLLIRRTLRMRQRIAEKLPG
jgi:hypothetical protein